MKRLVVGLAVLGFGLPLLSGRVARADVDESVLKAEAERVAVVAKARQAAVAIFAAGGQGGGSGVVISADGYALSNFHVTKGAGDAMKCGMADGRMYDAVIVGIDPVGDVALIKLFGRDDFPFADLGDSDRVRVGDWAFAVGNPFLLATDFQPTVTYGIISGTHRYQYPAGTLLEYSDCLQTDASINPGNSGGPLFNSQGQLIGINGRGSFEKRGRVNVGVGYAVSINQIKNFLGYLRSGRIVDHATLGARVKTHEDGRVLVADILEDCDAFRRGLQQGDEITSFGGRQIRTVNAFKNVLGIFPKDWRVPLSYRRGETEYTTLVRLEGVHSTEELLSKVQGRPRAQPAPRIPMPRQPGDPKRRDRAPGPPEEPKQPFDPENPQQPENPEQPEGPEQPQKSGDKSPMPGKRAPRLPRPGARRPGVAPMPAIVKEHYEARHGYANYYFNKLFRDQTWQRFVARGDFSALTGEWTVRGVCGAGLAGQGDAELRISAATSAATLPGGRLQIEIGDDLTGAADPPGSGGLLAALHLWRRMLVMGPEKFGDVYYLGSLPLAGHEGLAEALVATYGGVQSRFLFDATTGNLLAMEVFLRSDDDPCELHFADFAEVEGRVLPKLLEVRHGDQLYCSIKLASFKLDKDSDQKEADQKNTEK
jgi:serine protease Do